MVIRIVRMHFKTEQVDAFLKIFNANKEAIRNFPGCSYMDLMRDVSADSVLVTISHWNSAEDLENYRQSPLFNSIWFRVKKLFSGKPEAFTVEQFS